MNRGIVPHYVINSNNNKRSDVLGNIDTSSIQRNYEKDEQPFIIRGRI
jgi:hypothetical protein